MIRSGRAHPQLISIASNGLKIQGYSDSALKTMEGPEIDLDISGNNSTPSETYGGATCASDGAGGRTCTITIIENVGNYYFEISTYASAPASPGGFSGLTSLDSGVTPMETLSAGTTAPPILVTLGGTVNTLQLNVPQSLAETVSGTVPVGVVALDAASEIIISSAAYSTPISFSVTPSSGLTASIQVNGGGSSTSTLPSDIITLNFAYTAESPGATVAITATSGSATATSNISPLIISDGHSYATATPTSPPVISIAINSPNTGDTIIFTEGTSYVGNFTISADSTTHCGGSGSGTATAGQPLLFSSGNTTSTVPPAAIAAAGGSATFTVTTSAFATMSGPCVYDVSDGTKTVEVLSIFATFNETGSVGYTANVPGGLLYLTAVQGTYIAPNAVASPGYLGSLLTSAVLMYAPSAPATTYQINDPTLEEPLGIAHDLAGDVFVADYAAHIINEYTPTDIAPSPSPTSGVTPAPTVTAYASYNYPNPGPSGQLAPDGLAFNTKTSTLYVADNESGYIAELSAPLPMGETTQSRRGGRTSVRNATSPHVAATLRNPESRRRALGMTTTATITAYFYVGGNPAGIAFDSADDLFVSFPNTGIVSEYAPVDSDTGTVTLTPIANFTGTSIPSAIAIASGGTRSGDLYVFDAGGTGLLDFFSPSNIAAPTSSGYGYSPAASAFAIDGSGNVYTTSNPPGSQTLMPSQVNISKNGGTPVPFGPVFQPANNGSTNTRTLYIPFATF